MWLDLGITNRFISYFRSWLILFIVTSQSSFDHRLNLAIYLTASVWVNWHKRNRELGWIYSPKTHGTFHFSRFNKDPVLDPSRVSSLFAQPKSPPGCFLILRVCCTVCIHACLCVCHCLKPRCVCIQGTCARLRVFIYVCAIHITTKMKHLHKDDNFLHFQRLRPFGAHISHVKNEKGVFSIEGTLSDLAWARDFRHLQLLVRFMCSLWTWSWTHPQ